MQAVKNLLHKNDSRGEHSEETHRSNDQYASEHHNTAGSHHNTAGSGVGATTMGSTTGDSSRTGLSSSATPTNDAATRETGLATERHADTTHGGSGRASHGLGHTAGHDSSVGSKFDPTSENTTHDHKHLDHVTHRDVRHVEVEEVERQREHDRHVHHVQHHVQPVVDKQVKDEVHHTNAVPVTQVHEKHTSTNEDRQLFDGLASQHKDSEVHRGKERTVVDLGERVHENIHHHVHHVTQPVVEQEVVDRHRIHTVIPVHQTTHEAPIIHKSSTHEPIAMDAFLSGGGKIGSGIKHHEANVLSSGDSSCERSVDGVGEKMAADLHLGSAGTGAGTYAVGGTERRRRSSSASSSDRENLNRDGTTGKGKHIAADGERHKTSLGAKADDKM